MFKNIADKMLSRQRWKRREGGLSNSKKDQCSPLEDALVPDPQTKTELVIHTGMSSASWACDHVIEVFPEQRNFIKLIFC